MGPVTGSCAGTWVLCRVPHRDVGAVQGPMLGHGCCARIQHWKVGPTGTWVLCRSQRDNMRDCRQGHVGKLGCRMLSPGWGWRWGGSLSPVPPSGTSGPILEKLRSARSLIWSPRPPNPKAPERENIHRGWKMGPWGWGCPQASPAHEHEPGGPGDAPSPRPGPMCLSPPQARGPLCCSHQPKATSP